MLWKTNDPSGRFCTAENRVEQFPAFPGFESPNRLVVHKYVWFESSIGVNMTEVRVSVFAFNRVCRKCRNAH